MVVSQNVSTLRFTFFFITVSIVDKMTEWVKTSIRTCKNSLGSSGNDIISL